MSRISKKTLKRQNYKEEPMEGEPLSSDSVIPLRDDEFYGPNADEIALIRHKWVTNIWAAAATVIVFCVIFGLTHNYREEARKLRSRKTAYASASTKSVAAELGIEKPSFLPLSPSEKKEAESKIKEEKERERQKFVKKHKGHASCVRCCSKHNRCKYCGKNMDWSKTYAADHHHRR